ncbi:MAG: recombinase family protein, partial [Planctomycetota bacterium]|nr:recombinase family protein [Planctomycetota bacterium]
MERETTPDEREDATAIDPSIGSTKPSFVHVGRDSCMWVDEAIQHERPQSRTYPMASSARDPKTTKIYFGKKTSAEAGWHQGGVTPFGYRRRFDPHEGHTVLVREEQEAATVRWIFEEYVSSGSIDKVRNRLEAEGKRNADGRSWSRSSIAFMLSNETYTGVVKFAGEGHAGKHEPIVPQALFEAARNRRIEGRKRPASGDREGRECRATPAQE